MTLSGVSLMAPPVSLTSSAKRQTSTDNSGDSVVLCPPARCSPVVERSYERKQVVSLGLQGASARFTPLTFLHTHTHTHLEINSVARTHACGNKQSYALFGKHRRARTGMSTLKQHLYMDATPVRDKHGIEALKAPDKWEKRVCNHE